MPPAAYDVLALSPQCPVVLPLTIAHQCGQAFRWRKVLVPARGKEPRRLEWSLCLRDRVVFVTHDRASHALLHRTVYAPNAARTDTASWLRDYLNLDTPAATWFEEWSAKDPVFAKHAQRFAGGNILRQDPWECMCASNNNIPRISQMVHKLCEHFSPWLHVEDYPPGARLCHTLDMNELADEPEKHVSLAYHPFPPPTRLAQPDVEGRLRALGFGYRAKYLAQTAAMLCEKAREALPLGAPDEKVDEAVYAELLQLRHLSYYDARERLLPLAGIGPKVADCILLMSLDQASSIPVDRHVFQFAERWYGIRTKRYEEVADRLRAIWGERAGWAHSFLFYADLPSLLAYEPDADVKVEPKAEPGEAPNPEDCAHDTDTKPKVEGAHDDMPAPASVKLEDTDGVVPADPAGRDSRARDAIETPSKRARTA
ncbi:OGG1 [Malassezia furfur]|nr:OGG1 [Malassezia furfur]